MSSENIQFAGHGRGRQLVLLTMELMALILPLVFTCTQPPLASAGLIALLLFSMGMAAVHARMYLLRLFVVPAIASILGLSLTLGSLLSGVWGFFIGVFSFCLGIALLLTWSARLAFGSSHGVPAGYSTLAQPAKAAAMFRGQSANALMDGQSLAGGLSRSIWQIFSSTPIASSDRWSVPPDLQVVVPSVAAQQVASESVGLDASGHLVLAAPAGGHVLRGEPFLLGQPAPGGYRLWLDDSPTGLILDAGQPVVWREDGQVLICRACPESQPDSYASWLWQADSGWSLAADPWQSLSAEPLLDIAEPSLLDARGVWRRATLRPVMTERPDYGYHLVESREVGQAVAVRLCTPLGGGGRQATTLYLAPMLGQIEPRMTWLRDSADGCHGAFACHIGAWTLDGEWCLDHRVSDCGRYLALFQFAEAPFAPHRLAIADVLAKRVVRLDDVLVGARLLAFRDGTVSLLRVLGRLSEGKDSTPLQRFDQALPELEHTERFVSSRLTGRLYYERAQVAVDAHSLHLLPAWCLTGHAAIAGDNVVLPAPNGRDAAWLFGAGDDCADWPAGGSGAYLLTASGCALTNLAHSMAWSEDGRYLALIRLRHAIDAEPVRLLLLDVAERTMRQVDCQLAAGACALDFDAAGLHVRPAEAEDSSLLSWQELFNSPMQMLIRSGTLWFTAEELSGAASWGSVDARHLEHWRGHQPG